MSRFNSFSLKPIPDPTPRTVVDELNIHGEEGARNYQEHLVAYRRQGYWYSALVTLTCVGLASFVASFKVLSPSTPWYEPYLFMSCFGLALAWLVLSEMLRDRGQLLKEAKGWAEPLSSTDKCVAFEELVTKYRRLSLVPQGRELILADYEYAKERVEAFTKYELERENAEANRAACARLHSLGS